MLVSDPGFAVRPGVMPQAEFSAIAGLLQSDLRSRAGRRHLLASESVRSVANDPRMLAIARDFIGSPAIPFKATLFDKSPDSNWLVVWHQDIALPVRARVDADGWGPWSTKGGQLYAHAPAAVLEQVIALRLHLDDSTAENGPLRVLPGTHTLGRLSEERIRGLAREVTPVECIVNAGGVVAMRPLVIHASSKSRSQLPRRVLHIGYAKSMDLGADVQLAVTYQPTNA
jgi:ectoine hydroxylase-related dioxygenase (phytanoyl-CoA dioxygenase family)